MFTIIIVIGVAVVSLLGGYFLRKFIAEQKIHDAETQAKYVIEQAKKEAADRHRAAELEAKDLLYRMRQDFEQQTKDRRQEIASLEKGWRKGKRTLTAGLTFLNVRKRSGAEGGKYQASGGRA